VTQETTAPSEQTPPAAAPSAAEKPVEAKTTETPAPRTETPPSAAASSEPSAEKRLPVEEAGRDERAVVEPKATPEPSETTGTEAPSDGPEAKPTAPKTSRKKMTPRRGIQLKSDLVTQYKQERGDNGEDDKPNGDKPTGK